MAQEAAPSYSATPAPVSDAAQPGTSAGTAQIPFDPPIDTAMHYRIIRSFEGEGMPPGSVVVDQVLTVRPAEPEGWYLTIDTRSIVVDGRTFTPASDLAQLPMQEDVVLLHAPLTVSLDESGRVVRVENWQSYGAGLLKLPLVRPWGRHDPRVASQLRAAMIAMIRQFVAGPAENAASVAAPWKELLSYGRMEFSPGEPREWSDLRTFMNGEAVVTFDGKLTVTPRDDGTFVIDRETTTSPDGFAEAVDTARKRRDPQGLKDAEELRKNGSWMMDYDTIVHSRAVLDSNGMIMNLTLTSTTQRDDRVSAIFKMAIDRVVSGTDVGQSAP